MESSLARNHARIQSGNAPNLAVWGQLPGLSGNRACGDQYPSYREPRFYRDLIWPSAFGPSAAKLARPHSLLRRKILQGFGDKVVDAALQVVHHFGCVVNLLGSQ